MDLFKSMAHPGELASLLKFKYGGGKEKIMPPMKAANMSPNLVKCYYFLDKTSRSFSAVIRALDQPLRDAICIFYLVLRALDTAEDDMTISIEEKVPLLRAFHEKLYEPDWKYMDSTEKDRQVLEEFPIISSEFRNLATHFQEIIADITKKMGSGMCVFLRNSVGSMAEWDEYCHYVAGLVGIGLSKIFAASRLESEEVGSDEYLANSMGLFLQKTNIIRDYLEDIQQGRRFWPKEAWGQFSGDLDDLQHNQNQTSALACLNLLVTNALRHVPDQLVYMERLQNQTVFNFCSIPQVMAMATLALCYNNPSIFTGVVKIRRGQAVELMMVATDMDSFKGVIYRLCLQLLEKISPLDPSAVETRKITCKILSQCSDAMSCTPPTTSWFNSVNLYGYFGATTIVLLSAYAAVHFAG